MSERAETPKTLCPECGFVAGALFGILAGLVLAVAFWPRSAEARWSPGAAARITEHRAIFLRAAEATGTDPVLLASIAAHETHARAVAGGKLDADGQPTCFGPLQVHWPTWAGHLRAAGVASEPKELLDFGVGVLAGARILAYKQRTYRPRTQALLVCLFGVGGGALGFETDCKYSRDVLANWEPALWALWRGRGR